MDNLFVSIPERANYSVADPELLFYYEDLNERVWNLVSEVDDSLLDFARHVIRWNRGIQQKADTLLQAGNAGN